MGPRAGGGIFCDRVVFASAASEVRRPKPTWQSRRTTSRRTKCRALGGNTDPSRLEQVYHQGSVGWLLPRQRRR
jgi:hypothetical protein